MGSKICLFWHFHQCPVPRDDKYMHFGSTLGYIPDIIDKANSLYERIFSLHLDRGVKMNMNLTGVLAESLNGKNVSLIREGLRRKIFDMTSTGYYHPLLPLLPCEDIERQVTMNDEMLKKTFGHRARGFFLPEMAFDPFLIEILSEKYEWLIGEDEWYKLTVPRWTENDLRRVWHVWGSSGKKMRMLFRHREASRLLWKLGENEPRRRMREILDLFAISREDVCLLLAMDAEVWGLYGGDNLQNLTWFLEEAEKRKIEICLINEIMDKMSPKEGPETILFFPAYTWAHVEEEYGLESRENCTYYNWTHNDREKILQSLVDSARIEIKKAEATGAGAEEAWKSLLAAEASDWSGWQHIPFRSLLGRELACRAYRLAKKAQEAGESRENAAEKRRK